MRVLSLFSGVGGMDMGLERAGHEIVGMCEIDKQARRVLRRHWPDVPLHDDVTTFDVGAFRGRVNLVAGGSPCQDLSVAGRRAGLDGERSGLFWHQCRIADSVAAPWVLWENVAGAFSSNNGADFAAVLWGITGALPDVPDGGWRNMGICIGPKRTAVWRLLDAQWFGVPQRRRRVFVVGGPTDGRWLEVLLEPESCDRDSQPSATPGQGVAGDATRRSDKHRRDEYVGSLTAMDGWERPDNAHAEAGWLIPFVKAKRASSDTDDETWVCGAPAPTLNAMDNGGETRATVLAAVALTMRGRDNGAQLEVGEPDIYNSLRAGNGGSSRANNVLTPDLAVRRLTPVECERLMGWPDDWTRWADDGDEIADSHRYRMCGNGVVSNVTEWIGQRLAEVEQ